MNRNNTRRSNALQTVPIIMPSQQADHQSQVKTLTSLAEQAITSYRSCASNYTQLQQYFSTQLSQHQQGSMEYRNLIQKYIAKQTQHIATEKAQLQTLRSVANQLIQTKQTLEIQLTNLVEARNNFYAKQAAQQQKYNQFMQPQQQALALQTANHAGYQLAQQQNQPFLMQAQQLAATVEQTHQTGTINYAASNATYQARQQVFGGAQQANRALQNAEQATELNARILGVQSQITGLQTATNVFSTLYKTVASYLTDPNAAKPSTDRTHSAGPSFAGSAPQTSQPTFQIVVPNAPPAQPNLFNKAVEDAAILYIRNKNQYYAVYPEGSDMDLQVQQYIQMHQAHLAAQTVTHQASMVAAQTNMFM